MSRQLTQKERQGSTHVLRVSRLHDVPSAIVLFLPILTVGSILRFLNLGLVRHTYDDSYAAYDALRMLDARELLLVGQPTSVFLDNPPLMSYLQAIPLSLWRSPWGIYIFITALDTLAIWFVYRSAQELLGRAVGLLAALLFAINPWVVYFSREAWQPALMPFFTALIAWGLWPAIATRRCSSSRVLIASLTVTAMIQSYLPSVGVLAQMGLLVALFRRRLPRWPLYIGMLVFIVGLAIYCIGLRGRWESNWAKLTGFSLQGKVHLTREGANHAVRLVTGRDFEYVYTRQQTNEYLVRRGLSLAAHFGLAIAVLAGLAKAAIEVCQQRRHRQTAVVLLVWFLVPILLTSVSAYPVHPHYLLLSLPAGHILAAWGISPLLRRRPLGWVVTAALLSIAVLFGLNIHRANEAVARWPTAPNFEGWALSAGARVGATIRELSQGDRYPRRIYAQGHEVVLSSLSSTYLQTLQGLDFPEYVVLPHQEPLLYVLVNAAEKPEGLGPLWQSLPDRDILFADGTQVSFARALPHGLDDALALPDQALAWPSEAGLSMLGYSLSPVAQPGQAVRLTTYWRVEELRPGRAEWYVGAFYHLLDKEGQTLTNVSGHSQWGYRWQLGDVYVEQVSVPVPADIPPGEYQLEIGLFDTIHGANYYLHSPDGPTYALAVPIIVRKTA